MINIPPLFRKNPIMSIIIEDRMSNQLYSIQDAFNRAFDNGVYKDPQVRNIANVISLSR